MTGSNKFLHNKLKSLPLASFFSLVLHSLALPRLETWSSYWECAEELFSSLQCFLVQRSGFQMLRLYSFLWREFIVQGERILFLTVSSVLAVFPAALLLKHLPQLAEQAGPLSAPGVGLQDRWLKILSLMVGIFFQRVPEGGQLCLSVCVYTFTTTQASKWGLDTMLSYSHGFTPMSWG